MSQRFYANAPATALTNSCSSSATLIEVGSTAGLPIQYPFTLIIDRGTSTEEAVSVTNASGTTLTVTRAIDGTTAFAHSLGATVEHGITAQDVREPNTHINSNSNVHGVTGDVVGTTDAQILTNKDLSGAGNTFPATLATDSDVAAVQSDIDTHEAAHAAHGATGEVVGTTNAQTLFAKTFASTCVFPSSVAKSADLNALDSRVTDLEARVHYIRAGASGNNLAPGETRSIAAWDVASSFGITASGSSLVLAKDGLYMVAWGGYADAASGQDSGFRINLIRNGIQISSTAAQDIVYGGVDSHRTDAFLCSAGDAFTAEIFTSSAFPVGMNIYSISMSLIRVGA